MVVGGNVYTRWLGECDKNSLASVGGKNANLGEMIRKGIPVPPGFAVTVDAYRCAISKSGLKEDQINSLFSSVQPRDAGNTHILERVSQSIRDAMRKMTVPLEVVRAIDNCYRALSDKCGISKDVPVAVRSSATAEDLPTASFAGQQETYLWVRGTDEVKKAVVECWSSLFTPRAISYRIRNGIPHDKVSISVGIQKMVNAKAAGVMFSLNPITGDPSTIVISGSWGLGEAVVSGSVTPDEWLVDKVIFQIIGRRLGPKQVEHVVNLNTNKIEVVHVSDNRQKVYCLTDDEILELAKFSKCLEDHYGLHQDTEWAVDKDLQFPENVMIVQTRPETVWSQREIKPKVGKGVSALDYIAKVVKSK
jgi:pyruvate,water dikinase